VTFLFVKKLKKIQHIKQSPYSGKTNNIHHNISRISGEELQRVHNEQNFQDLL
jgi:hypothetical protein